MLNPILEPEKYQKIHEQKEFRIWLNLQLEKDNKTELTFLS